MLSEIKNTFRLTLDSSVIVAYLINEDEHREFVFAIWDKIFTEEIDVFIPVTVLSEVVSAIKRRSGSKSFSEEVKNLMLNSSRLQLIDVNLERSAKAADIAIKYGLRGMDSLIVQISEEYKTELITFDREIEEKYLSRIKKR
ncbi:MAG: type II toxin-antitoxin system VapC family toxin [Ignavibacteria bacterium]|nr:type II toxin-antitoxin system VapC family toxin [Ignavibacteria bacterium]